METAASILFRPVKAMPRSRSIINTDRAHCSGRRKRDCRGFTLIEVLVALAVIAIGLLAVLSVAARSTHVSMALQQRNFANWIAQNRIARLRIAPEWPSIGTSTGRVHFANQKWRYKTKVAKTSDKDLRRVTVTVSLADKPDTVVTRLIGFIGKQASKPLSLPGPMSRKPPKKGSG